MVSAYGNVRKWFNFEKVDMLCIQKQPSTNILNLLKPVEIEDKNDPKKLKGIERQAKLNVCCYCYCCYFTDYCYNELFAIIRKWVVIFSPIWLLH